MRTYIDLRELMEATKGSGANNDPTGALVRHAMVAIAKKKSTRGAGTRGKARAARNIAQAAFSRAHGDKGPFLQPGKRNTYRVTSRGSKRNMVHAMEPDNTAKQSEYERLHKAER